MWWGDRLSDSSRLNQLNWFRAVLKDWNVHIFSPAEVKDSWDTLGALFFWTCSLACAPLPFGAVISAWQAFDLGISRLCPFGTGTKQQMSTSAASGYGEPWGGSDLVDLQRLLNGEGCHHPQRLPLWGTCTGWSPSISQSKKVANSFCITLMRLWYCSKRCRAKYPGQGCSARLQRSLPRRFLEISLMRGDISKETGSLMESMHWKVLQR